MPTGSAGYAQMQQSINELYELYSKSSLEDQLNKKEKSMEETTKLEVEVVKKDHNYGDSRNYRYYINRDCVLSLNQIPYPNCCGITIIKDFSQSRGLSSERFNEIIDAIVKDLQKNDRYSKIILYTNKGSRESTLFSAYPEIVILDPFRNRRSSNILVGFEIILWKEAEVTEEYNDENEWYNDGDEESEDDFLERTREEEGTEDHDHIAEIGAEIRRARVFNRPSVADITTINARPSVVEVGQRPIQSGSISGFEIPNPWIASEWIDMPTGINRSSDNS